MAPIKCSYAFVIGAIFMGLLVNVAQGAIIVQGTRVVFPEKSREVTLRINNVSVAPVLVQSWVDDGQSDALPEDLQVPFIVAPAVTRVDSGSTAVLRISSAQPQLPTDRESLFWLNVLEMPPRSSVDETVLQFSFRTRIKLFFRPDSLGPDASGAADSLTWKLIRNVAGKGKSNAVLEVTNPSPYYVSFGRVGAQFKATLTPAGTGMVEPFGTAQFTLSLPITSPYQKASVQYEVINDYGGRRIIEKPLAK